MQDLDHKFATETAADAMAARTEAALASIEAERREKVRKGYVVLRAFAGINPQSPAVGIARLIVLGTLFIAPNYLLFMHVWGN